MAAHIATVGWDAPLIEGLCDPVAARLGCAFSHLLIAPTSRRELPNAVRLPPQKLASLPSPDRVYLASLERSGEPTIYTMLAGDRILMRRPPEHALRYASYLAKWIRQELVRLSPDVVIGGFDGLHAGLGRAVAHSLGLPWFAMHFTVMPKGLASFCDGLTPNTVVPLGGLTQSEATDLARDTISEFRSGVARVPLYVSSTTLRQVIERLPGHARHFVASLKRTILARHDEAAELTVGELARQYVRKRVNASRLRSVPMRRTPPDGPFAFFGLHMQPESSIDTWAPFYANQFAVVEAFARATPVSHRLLVKLHRSAADAYSPADLARFLRLPGVELVAPDVPSRAFIERASVVCTIQGSMGLEAALLGRPVLQLGDSLFTQLPSVSRGGRTADLPDDMRRAIQAAPPSDAEILRGFAAYLGAFAKGCYNDWARLPNSAELDDLAALFAAMLRRVGEQRATAEARV